MKTLPIKIRDKIAVYNSADKVVCYNSDYLLEFDFDAEWIEYKYKTAIVRYFKAPEGWIKHEIIFEGATCELPVIDKAAVLYVGVFAGDIRTTTEAEIPCRPSILSFDGAPVNPPDDVYNQIMQKLNEIEQNGASPEQIAAAIEQYLAGNPFVKKETDPTVFRWAKAELFDKNDLVDPAGRNSFVTIDDIEYYRYNASAQNFEWNNPNPQTGSVAITARGVSQYGGTGSTRLHTFFDDGTEGEPLFIIVNGESRTVTYTTPSDKVLAKITGNYDMENWVLLDMSVMSCLADYPAPTGTVKSVNGNLPDENGNVEIPSGGGSGTDIALGITGAAVGQIARITAVDDAGIPTAWEAVEFPDSGGFKKIVDYTTTEQVWTPDINKIIFTEDLSGNPINAENLYIKLSGIITGSTYFRVAINKDGYYAEPYHGTADAFAVSQVFIAFRSMYFNAIYKKDSNYVGSITKGPCGSEKITMIQISGGNYNTMHLEAGARIEVWEMTSDE